jgi:Tfp pilus assembly ATPase PilU
MQYFDGEIDKLIRSGVVDFETGLAFASNAGNLRLELADFMESRASRSSLTAPAEKIEMEIER